VHRIITIFLIAILAGCFECDDCAVINNGPLLPVRFFSYADSSTLPVNIQSLNSTPSGQLTVIGDTLLSDYRLPLDINADISIFILNTFKATDTLMANLLIDTLVVVYDRVIFENEKNFLQMQADSIGIIQHSFDSIALKCSFPNCSNQDVLLEIFY